MGVLADLIPDFQPAYYDEGCIARATAGATWRWKFAGFVDNAGDPIDLSDPSVTGTCVVIDDAGAPVVAFVFTGAADGSCTIEVDEANTAGLADPGGPQGRRCRWYFFLDDGVDVAQVWGAADSTLTILPEA